MNWKSIRDVICYILSTVENKVKNLSAWCKEGVQEEEEEECEDVIEEDEEEEDESEQLTPTDEGFEQSDSKIVEVRF